MFHISCEYLLIAADEQTSMRIHHLYSGGGIILKIVENLMPSYYCNFTVMYITTGSRGGVVVEALCYNPEGHGFNSRWCQRIFFYIIHPVTLWPWGRLSL
jgi:hypothetical protein